MVPKSDQSKPAVRPPSQIPLSEIGNSFNGKVVAYTPCGPRCGQGTRRLRATRAAQNAQTKSKTAKVSRKTVHRCDAPATNPMNQALSARICGTVGLPASD